MKKEDDLIFGRILEEQEVQAISGGIGTRKAAVITIPKVSERGGAVVVDGTQSF